MSKSLISAKQKREFSERGFFFTDVMIGPEDLAMLRRESMRHWSESLDEASEHAHLATQKIRPFLPSLHLRSRQVASFIRSETFCTMARELVGSDVDQVWNQSCLKFPDEGGATAFPFHQDWQFSEISVVKPNFSCFLALTPLSVENGTLQFAAGVDGRRLAHHRNAELGWWECSVDGLEVTPGILSPGQMVVYNVLTPHGSSPNLSSEAREAFVVSFGVPGLSFDSGEPFGDRRPLLRDGALVPE